MKTVICVPSMDTVPVQFCQSLAMLDKKDCYLAFKTGSLVYIARNELAKLAIKLETDYVLWLDSDMTFEPDLMERLFKTMEEEKASIVSGLYFKRVPPYKPVGFDSLIIDGSGNVRITDIEAIPDKPFKAAAIGFGCVLMKTDVLISVMAEFGELFNPMPNAGEDIAFCWRAKQCGYDIVIDPRIECGHVGHYVVTSDLYKAMNRS